MKMKKHMKFSAGSINWEEIERIIESRMKDCRTCNLPERKAFGNVCKECPFTTCCWYILADGTRRPRVYPKAEIFGPLGLIHTSAMGKATFFHFLDNREMNFCHLPLPEVDLEGNISEVRAVKLGLDIKDKKVKAKYNIKWFVWNIHHENERWWDDRECNRLLCLNTEHKAFAQMSD